MTCDYDSWGYLIVSNPTTGDSSVHVYHSDNEFFSLDLFSQAIDLGNGRCKYHPLNKPLYTQCRVKEILVLVWKETFVPQFSSE